MSKNKWSVDLKKPATIGVLLFLILMVFMLVKEAKADTILEVAPESTFIAGHHQTGSVLFLTERFNSKYDIGIALATALDCRSECSRGPSETNQGLYAQRIVHYHSLELGIGISYWHNTSAAWSSHTPFALHLGWNFNDHLNVRYRHFSTGGSSENNGGWDLLTVGWAF